MCSLIAGLDVTIDDNILLRLAASLNNIEAAKMLIKAGADVHAGNDAAIAAAKEKGFTEMVKLLEA